MKTLAYLIIVVTAVFCVMTRANAEQPTEHERSIENYFICVSESQNWISKNLDVCQDSDTSIGCIHYLEKAWGFCERRIK